MPTKKKEDATEENTTDMNETNLTDETSVEESGSDASGVIEENTQPELSNADAIENSSSAEPSLLSSVFDTLTSVVGSVAEAVVGGASELVNAVTNTDSKEESVAASNKISKRAERIGTVQSDKMMKTVTVRVDRLIKHPMYRKYVKRHKKFMAHDELGAKTGDKVRIIETRPLSARKRWRVVEIVQKAEK